MHYLDFDFSDEDSGYKNHMKILSWGLASILLAGGVLVLWQLRKFSADERDSAEARRELLKGAALATPPSYDPRMVAELPEPARRLFNFAIAPGTPLKSVVEIKMAGELSLGTKQEPNYLPMRARQVLAAPHGFVWEIEAGKGLMRVSGSDGMLRDRSWTRFWLLRAVPVARVDGDSDHLRSSFGRLVAEAAFWSPAFLLPREGVVWTQVDKDTARASVTHGALAQSVDIHVDAAGQPLWASLPRWSNANPQKIYRVQPFGGELSDFRTVEGFRVPFRVDGGNFFGTPDYFPFYRARVLELRFS